MSRIGRYADFWPYYLGEHAHPLCRRLHFVGTSLVIALALVALATRRWGIFALVPVAGYGFAWVAHFAVEKNRPATFTYPLWSLGSDFVMWWKMATGRLDGELARLGIAWRPPAER